MDKQGPWEFYLALRVLSGPRRRSGRAARNAAFVCWGEALHRCQG